MAALTGVGWGVVESVVKFMPQTAMSFYRIAPKLGAVATTKFQKGFYRYSATPDSTRSLANQPKKALEAPKSHPRKVR